MTNEEAVRMLKAKLECMIRDVSGCDDDCNRKLCGECHLNYEQGNMGEQKECLRMSIEALERESCEDAISRQAVIDVLKDKWNMFSDANDAMQESIDTIEALKPVTPQQKVGHWIRVDKDKLKCSKCEVIHLIAQYPNGKIDWCPMCGAKMQEVSEE